MARVACGEGRGVKAVKRLLLAHLLSLAATVSIAQGAPSPVAPQTFKAAVSGSSVVEVRIPVLKLAGGQRLVFSSLRSTARLKRIELIDPRGAVAWSGVDSKILLVRRQETRDPARGDVYLVGETADGAEGEWVLRLSPDGDQKGVVSGLYTVRPRVELQIPHLRFGEPDGVVGEPLLVMVMPMEMGKPISGLKGVSVRLAGPDGKTVEVTAKDSVRTVLGVELPLPAGQYLAKFEGLAAGKYRATGRAIVNGATLAGEREVVVTLK